jgi:plastocyanin
MASQGTWAWVGAVLTILAGAPASGLAQVDAPACPFADGDATIAIVLQGVRRFEPACVQVASGAEVTFVVAYDTGCCTVHAPDSALDQGACFHTALDAGFLTSASSYRVRLFYDGDHAWSIQADRTEPVHDCDDALEVQGVRLATADDAVLLFRDWTGNVAGPGAIVVRA